MPLPRPARKRTRARLRLRLWASAAGAPQKSLADIARMPALHRYYLDDCRPSGPRAYGASSSACPLGCIAISSHCSSKTRLLLTHHSSLAGAGCAWRVCGRGARAEVGVRRWAWTLVARGWLQQSWPPRRGRTCTWSPTAGPPRWPPPPARPDRAAWHAMASVIRGRNWRDDLVRVAKTRKLLKLLNAEAGMPTITEVRECFASRPLGTPHPRRVTRVNGALDGRGGGGRDHRAPAAPRGRPRGGSAWSSTLVCPLHRSRPSPFAMPTSRAFLPRRAKRPSTGGGTAC